MESPIKAHDLFLIRRRNFLGLNLGRLQSRGFHLQWRYPESGLPFFMQF
jgi:hypothetical protein